MIFKIEKGNHYSNFNLAKLQPFARVMEGTINIDIGWWHKPEDIPHSGWNKLTGISETDIPFCKERGIHWNSGRLVAKPAKEKGCFDIAGYVYSEGVRTEEYITTIKANKYYSFYVGFYKDGEWEFGIGDYYLFMDGVAPRGITRKCYPYFGGLSVAIETCITEINRD